MVCNSAADDRCPAATTTTTEEIHASTTAVRKIRHRVERDSQDKDSQDREALPAYVPSPKKKGGARFACMIDSNPELNPTQGTSSQHATAPQKKENLNAHITDKFKDMCKIYEMVGIGFIVADIVCTAHTLADLTLLSILSCLLCA
jgi:hypothetical protein